MYLYIDSISMFFASQVGREPSNQASANSSLTRCKFLIGYNLIFSGEAVENQPLKNGYSP